VTALRTIGYEGRSVDELIRALTDAQVTRLIDVRDLPLSRKRGFSKSALRETVEGAGIAYEHAKELGNPKENRERYRSGDARGGAAVYRARLAHEARPALLGLAETLADGGACLLCYERDPAACHRILIVEALEERIPALRIEHL
jgi:uncharacterized protein (DUF488 family)